MAHTTILNQRLRRGALGDVNVPDLVSEAREERRQGRRLAPEDARSPGFIAGVGASLQPTGFVNSLAIAQGLIQPREVLTTRRGSIAPGGGRRTEAGTALDRLRTQLAGRQTAESATILSRLGLRARLGRRR